MSTGDIPHGFTITYEMRPDDFVDLMKTSAAGRRHRHRYTVSVVVWALLPVVIAADELEVRHQGTTVPSWVYAAQVFAVLIALFYGRALWRLSPRRLGARAWRRAPGFHGRAQDVIDDTGVSSTSPDGTRQYWPWTAITRVVETEQAFYLMNGRGEPAVALPKRGLTDPGLVPELRDFIQRSVGT
jgi:hypothetical protein